MLVRWEIFISFFRCFAKLRKATISFGVPARPFVYKEQIGSHWTRFYGIWHLSVFRKYVEEILLSLKSNKNDYFTLRPTYIYDTGMLISP